MSQIVAAVISGASRFDIDAIAAALNSELSAADHLELMVVASPDEATAAARDAAGRARIVIAVGGDGTVADVATGLFGSAAVLGIVPAGSTNITARSLGIPANPRRAIAVLAGPHEIRRIDVGRSADRSFLHIGGAGIDAEIVHRTRTPWKRRVGWLAYLPPALSSLSLEASLVHLSTDREQFEVRSPLVLVANGGAIITPEFRVYPGIATDDGWLDLLVFTPPSVAALASLLGRAGSQSLERSPHVRRWKVKRVRIDADPPLLVQLDGDVHGFTPREFAVAPLALPVVVPQAAPPRSPSRARVDNRGHPPR